MDQRPERDQRERRWFAWAEAAAAVAEEELAALIRAVAGNATGG